MIVKALDKQLVLKDTDTATDLKLQVLEADGITPIDLTDKNVTVVIGTDVGRVLTKVPTFTNELGHVYFGFDIGDIIPSGDYLLEVHIQEGLETRVAPSRKFYKLKVERSIDNIDDEITTVTLTFLMGEIEKRAVAGPIGPEGPVGPQGLQGPQGVVGPEGPKGDTGLKGDTGQQGQQGIQGPKGDVGPIGPQGPEGPQGIKGDRGPKGDKGDNFTVAATGPLDARSSYDTEAEGFSFLATDTGELYIRQGASGWSNAIPFGKGATGAEGPQGPKGDAGASDWVDITNKPILFPPSEHTHTELVEVVGDVSLIYNILDDLTQTDQDLRREIGESAGFIYDDMIEYSNVVWDVKFDLEDVQTRLDSAEDDLLQIGPLSKLTTVDKTTLVKAINEINAKSGGEEGQPIQKTLNRGLQVVNVPIGSPVNVLNFTGKTVINYAPLFDSGLWTLHANAVASSSNKLTVNVTASAQYSSIVIPVQVGKIYTLSAVHNGIIAVRKGNSISGTVVTSVTETSTSFTVDATFGGSIFVYLSNSQTTGTVTFENVMLNEGTTAREFVANVKGVTNPTIENKTTGDSLTLLGTFHEGENVTVDKGQAKVDRKKKEYVLDGSLGWAFSASVSGRKTVTLVGFNNTVFAQNTVIGIKYNGKILPYAIGANIKEDIVRWTDVGALSIEISNADSGWGDSYSPTADEIKAYFMGWKMYNNAVGLPNQYNGTGIKAWGKIGLQNADGTFSGTGGVDFAVTTLPTSQTAIYPKWQPYRLLYDLATPITETVKTIGSLKFAKGDNTLELTEGRIVRERVYPKKRLTTNLHYSLNTTKSSEWDSTQFTHKVEKIIKVYKNGTEDNLWFISKGTTESYGKEWATILATDFEPTAIYEVEYIAQEPYKVSAYTNPITIEYRDSLGGAVEELVGDTSSLESRMNTSDKLFNELLATLPKGSSVGNGGLETVKEVDFATTPTASLTISNLLKYKELRIIAEKLKHNYGVTANIAISFDGIALSGHTITNTTITNLTWSDGVGTAVTSSYSSNILVDNDGSKLLMIDGVMAVTNTSETSVSPLFRKCSASNPTVKSIDSITISSSVGQLSSGKITVLGVLK